jgi:hypothetical protein
MIKERPFEELEDLMKAKTLLTGCAIALASWFALVSGSSVFQNSAYAGDQSLTGNRSARNEQQAEHPAQRGAVRDDQWYQGQRGHWRQNHDRLEWQGAQGDQWYQGQPGHWYKESNGWQFGSQGTVCNDQGRNCRRGGNVPANGEGMVSRNNPNVFWACDSDGHHCRWARRPGY